MKTMVNIARVIVGLLFIFSGLVKANDPMGLSYKIQEFFEVWGWQSLNNYTLGFSILMNVFEIVAGVAVLIGWRMRLFSWLLLLLILFFTFLTGYAALSGKFRSCGCFGDCIPLQPLQSFYKDLFLLALILLIWWHRDKIETSIAVSKAIGLIALTAVLAFVVQGYALKHLPYKDCLGYKKGANLVENMKVPQGALPDSFAMTFVYAKAGKELELEMSQLGTIDSSYQFVKRNQKLVRKGNAEPKILDFALKTATGTDTTLQVLNTGNKYVLFFVKTFDRPEVEWKPGFDNVMRACKAKNMPLLVVTAEPSKAQQLLPGTTILQCDATAIKTAARTSPMYMLLQQANVLEKKSYADPEHFIKTLQP
jgi:uncharacterized membrane protein YphA (DoxX/SURF4 family)